MKQFIFFIIVFCTSTFFGYSLGAENPPKDYKPVLVTVHEGDTLEQICLKLKHKYNDERDWRYISWQASIDNELGQHIYPGLQIIFRVEVKR